MKSEQHKTNHDSVKVYFVNINNPVMSLTVASTHSLSHIRNESVQGNM